MAEIKTMNTQMLEIWENYLELCSIFNDKLEQIKADEILNINLQLLRATITDLNINLSNFKNELQYNQIVANDANTQNNKNKKQHILEDNKKEDEEDIFSSLNKSNANTSSVNMPKLNNQNLLGLFFFYLMQIDNDSILNTTRLSQSSQSSQSSQITNQNKKIIDGEKMYDYLELD